MIFQVLKDGQIKMQTSDEAFVPSKEQQAQMKKAGYKFKRVEGKSLEIKEGRKVEI